MTLIVFVYVFLLPPSSPYFKKLASYTKCLSLILISSVIIFNVTNLVLFYLWFEVSLIPIMFLILGWGYQSERLNASLSLIMYTIRASAPLLVFIVYI